MKYLGGVIIIVIAVTISLTIYPFSVSAEKVTRTTRFEVPDIHDDFCGAKIDFKICKCARHGEMCKDIGRERNVANFILHSRYNIYVTTLRVQFAASCTSAGGKFREDKCEYFEKTDKEKECLPADFSQNWKKYSDIDDAIPPNDRSFEAKSFYEIGEKLKITLANLYILERDLELNRLILNELKEYRKAIATNLKVNLLKSFWRLAWLTYDTAAGAAVPLSVESKGTILLQGGTDLGRSYVKLFTEDDLMPVQGLAIMAKLAREGLGDDSKYNFNTKTWDGKVGAVSVTTLIAFFESYANPIDTAKEMFQDMTDQAFTDVEVKLSDEDIKLLANQYNKTKSLDDALQEANRKRAQMESLRDELLKDKEKLMAEFADWETKEHERIQKLLTDKCEK